MRSLKNVRYDLTAADPSELEKRYEQRDLRQKSGESRSIRDRQHGGAPDRIARAAYREKRIEKSPRPFGLTGPLWLPSSIIGSSALCWGASVNLNLDYLGP